MTSNELEVLMLSYLIFQNNLRIMVTKITFLFCLRIVIMNPKSHFDNDWGLNLFLITTQH
jgi:hypothetical protein